MRAFTPAIGLGLLLLALWTGSALYLRRKRRKKEEQLRAQGQHAMADAQAAEHAPLQGCTSASLAWASFSMASTCPPWWAP